MPRRKHTASAGTALLDAQIEALRPGPTPDCIQRDPALLIGRTDEFKTIDAFVRDRISRNVGGSLYIYGQVGQGKTMTTQLVKELLKRELKIDVRTIQCAQFMGQMEAKSFLNELSTASSSALSCVVLDDIDVFFETPLVMKRLHELFHSSMVKREEDGAVSKLILIAIANLPKVEKRGFESVQGLQTLVFQPYTTAQLQLILKQRLDGCSTESKGEEKESKGESKGEEDDVRQCLAQKVWSESNGDVRQLLHLYAEYLRLSAHTNRNGATQPQLKRMIGLLTNYYYSDATATVKALNNQLQILLCIVSATVTGAGGKSVSLGDIIDHCETLRPVIPRDLLPISIRIIADGLKELVANKVLICDLLHLSKHKRRRLLDGSAVSSITEKMKLTYQLIPNFNLLDRVYTQQPTPAATTICSTILRNAAIDYMDTSKRSF